MTLQEFIDEASVVENFIFPGSTQVDAKLYAQFKKIMVGNLGKWKTNKGGFLFESKEEAVKLLESLKRGERPNWKKEREWFATPQEVAFLMFNAVVPWYNNRILEPTAGRGDLVDHMIDFMPGLKDSCQIDCVEIDDKNCEYLKKKGYNICGSDIFEYNPESLYDYIYANPPFSQINKYVDKFLSLLNKTGDLVCIVPSSFNPDPYNEKEGVAHASCYDIIPSGSFKSSGTMVNTKVLHVSKD